MNLGVILLNVFWGTCLSVWGLSTWPLCGCSAYLSKNGCPNKGNVEDTVNSDSLNWYALYCSLSSHRSGWRIRELIGIRSMSCSMSNTTEVAESPADVCPTSPTSNSFPLQSQNPSVPFPVLILLACTSSSACSIRFGATRADWSVGCGLWLSKRLIINAS